MNRASMPVGEGWVWGSPLSEDARELGRQLVVALRPYLEGWPGAVAFMADASNWDAQWLNRRAREARKPLREAEAIQVSDVVAGPLDAVAGMLATVCLNPMAFFIVPADNEWRRSQAAAGGCLDTDNDWRPALPLPALWSVTPRAWRASML